MQTTCPESRKQFAGYVRNDEDAFQDASSGKLVLKRRCVKQIFLLLRTRMNATKTDYEQD
jgi:hypothetical protein